MDGHDSIPHKVKDRSSDLDILLEISGTKFDLDGPRELRVFETMNETDEKDLGDELAQHVAAGREDIIVLDNELDLGGIMPNWDDEILRPKGKEYKVMSRKIKKALPAERKELKGINIELCACKPASHTIEARTDEEQHQLLLRRGVAGSGHRGAMCDGDLSALQTRLPTIDCVASAAADATGLRTCSSTLLCN
uniref:Uncharacterized protein n=1 Tax=Oryza glumipatula TaxID=40148 RepID=A0A0E0BFI8_9ORYZ